MTGWTVQPDGCWTWDGKRAPNGYGRLWVPELGRMVMAHRMAYERAHGPIPRGMVLDHTCHDPRTCAGGPTCPHRACVNPDHLRVTTTRQNTSPDRSAHGFGTGVCRAGHDVSDPANVYVWPDGARRTCRTCRALARRRPTPNPDGWGGWT